MNFFGRAKQPSVAEQIAATEREFEMSMNLFNRMTSSCLQKCLSGDYRESDLNKGESVCLDRCAAKFFDTGLKVMERMQETGPAQLGATPQPGGGLLR